MEQLTRRNVLGSMAAFAAGSLTLPAAAAAAIDQAPPETSILVPGYLIPIPVTSVRSIMNQPIHGATWWQMKS